MRRSRSSADVLGPAGRRAAPNLSFITLRKRVHAAGTATNVLKITCLGVSPAQAEALANDDANDLVTFVAKNGTSAESTDLAQLQQESSVLSKQIQSLNGEISSITNKIAQVGPSTSAGEQDEDLLGTLNASESQASLQLASVNDQITAAQLSSGAANAGTEVIQAATIATPPPDSRWVVPLLIGTLAGFLIIGVVVLIRAGRDRRLRQRQQIAEALGVSVLTSMETQARSKPREWMEFFRRYDPAAREQWRFRKVLEELGTPGAPHDITVLSFEGDEQALVIGPQMAVCAAVAGLHTVLQAPGSADYTFGLRTALKRIASVRRRIRPNLEIEDPGGLLGMRIAVVCVTRRGSQARRSAPAVLPVCCFGRVRDGRRPGTGRAGDRSRGLRAQGCCGRQSRP